MAITLQEKLKKLPSERQEAIRSRTAALIKEEYALREVEKQKARSDKNLATPHG
jgi:hypothetical protein